MMSSNLPNLLCVGAMLIIAAGCNFEDSYSGSSSERDLSSGADLSVDMSDLKVEAPDSLMTQDLATPVDACIPAPEVCNAQDDDCDGDIDEGCDRDGDGFCEEMSGELVPACPMGAGDCDDDNPRAFPDSPHELCGEPLDLDCDGKLKTFALTEDLIQPRLPDGTHGEVTRSRVLAIPEGVSPGIDASVMVVWLEKREVQGLWAQVYSVSGEPSGEPIQLASPLQQVSHFNAIIDPQTGLVGVGYYQKQRDDVIELMFMLLDAQGGVVAPATPIPFDEGSHTLPEDYFFLSNYPELHVQQGVFSLFFPFVDDTVLDYYHIAYDAEDTSFINIPKRIYSSTVTYLTPFVGWRQPENMERAGDYLIGTVEQDGMSMDLFELDPLSNEITAAYTGRTRDASKNIVTVSSGMDKWYLFESTPNTETASPFDRSVLVSTYEESRSGHFGMARETGIHDFRQSGDQSFAVKATLSQEAHLFYHTDRPSMTEPSSIGLSHTRWFPDLPNFVQPESIALEFPINGYSWTMDVLPDLSSVMTLDLTNDPSRRATHRLTNHRLVVNEGSTSALLFEAPEESAYPYPSIPGSDPGSPLTNRRVDGALQWVELYFENGMRRFKIHTLREDGGIAPVRLIGSPEPTSTASMYGSLAGNRFIVQVPTLELIRDANTVLVSCIQTYNLYAFDLNADTWTPLNHITVPMTAYVSSTNTKRCPTSSIGNFFVQDDGDLQAILTLRTTDEPSIPINPSKLSATSRLIALDETDVLFAPDANLDISGQLSLLPGARTTGYVLERDEDELVSSFHLYDLNTQGEPPRRFYSHDIPSSLGVRDIRLNAVPDSPYALALHLTMRTPMYTATAALMLFDSITDDSEPRSMDLGSLPIVKPSWEINYHDVYDYKPLHDGEKFVFSYFSTFFRQNASGHAFQRFLRVVWPEDERMAPADEFMEIPATRSYSLLHTLPIEEGVLVLYQDDISHHMVHFNEMLDEELQRLTWTFDAGLPLFSQGGMPQSTHIILNARATDALAWQWQLWAQPSSTNNGDNTFYQIDMACIPR